MGMTGEVDDLRNHENYHSEENVNSICRLLGGILADYKLDVPSSVLLDEVLVFNEWLTRVSNPRRVEAISTAGNDKGLIVNFPISLTDAHSMPMTQQADEFLLAVGIKRGDFGFFGQFRFYRLRRQVSHALRYLLIAYISYS